MEKEIGSQLINGIHMGLVSVDELIDKTDNQSLRNILLDLRKDYDDLKEKLLRHYPILKEEIKKNMMLDIMLKMKTMMTDDSKIAKMLIEGCNQAIIEMQELFNRDHHIDSDLKNCMHDFDEISKKYIEELKVYL